MTIFCNFWMICLELNGLFYGPSWMLQLSEFVWTLRSSAWVVFNNFLLIDATDRSKISSDQKRLFFSVSLYHLSFFAKTPFLKVFNSDFSCKFSCSRNAKGSFAEINHTVLRELLRIGHSHPCIEGHLKLPLQFL